MKRNNSYILREIAGVPYLLPFGQTIADHKRGMQINDTGIYLWHLLETDHTMEELLCICAAHYDASPEEIPILQKDLEQFLWQLSAYGILDHSVQKFPQNNITEYPVKELVASCTDHIVSESFHIASSRETSEDCIYLNIGKILLRLAGPKEYFSHNFDGFRVDPADTADLCRQSILLRTDNPPAAGKGEPILQSRDLVILKNHAFYVLLFPAAKQIREARLTEDGSLVIFYCIPPCTESLKEDLFHAIRVGFLYLAQIHHMAALHSASILYRGKAWLFSGPSGTGKSTHTSLWQRLFKTPVINGDLNLLALENNAPVIHGIPWCGTSGIRDTASHPLGGIFLLKQTMKDEIIELSPDKKRLLVMQRLISPSWTSDLADCNLQFVNLLADKILICRLQCTKEESAVMAAKTAIDSYLDRLP